MLSPVPPLVVKPIRVRAAAIVDPPAGRNPGRRLNQRFSLTKCQRREQQESKNFYR